MKQKTTFIPFPDNYMEVWFDEYDDGHRDPGLHFRFPKYIVLQSNNWDTAGSDNEWNPDEDVADSDHSTMDIVKLPLPVNYLMEILYNYTSKGNYYDFKGLNKDMEDISKHGGFSPIAEKIVVKALCCKTQKEFDEYYGSL